MRRRLLPTLAIVSLACCAGLCGLWVRSYQHYDFVSYGHGKRAVGVVIEGGGAETWWTRDSATACDGRHVESFSVDNVRVNHSAGANISSETWMVWYPLWLPALLAAIPPALWWRRPRKQRVSGFPVEIAADR